MKFFYWAEFIMNMLKNVLKPGGLMTWDVLFLDGELIFTWIHFWIEYVQ